MRTCLGILLALVVTWSVTAQTEQTSEEQSEVSILADFGFSDAVPGGRHSPVRVFVRAQDENISGRVELYYVGYDGYTGRVFAPVDVAAGGQATVSMVVPIPSMLSELILTLRDAGGKKLAESVYATLPSTTEIQFPRILDPSEELLLSLTSRVSADRIAKALVETSIESLPDFRGRSLTRALALTTEQSTTYVYSRVVGKNILTSSLPLSEKAYEGVMAVIADATTVRNTDPRAILALHRWVLGGGRLVIIADTPGDEWRRLVPPLVPMESLSLDTQREVPGVEELEVLTGEASSSPLLARPIAITLGAADLGWTSRWDAEEGPLLAEGPAGFGWVTLVSVHPDTASTGGLEHNLPVWADVLSGASLSVYMRDHSARTLLTTDRSYGALRVVEDTTVLVFDAIGSAPPIGSTAVLLVALVTISLAIALGPVDFLLLKLVKLRHLAWLSALGWILLASVFGVVMPDKLRSGSSTFGRHSLVDVLATNDALPGGETNPQNQAIANLPDVLRAWTLSFSNYFAGSTDPVVISEADSGLYWTEYMGIRGRAAVSRPLVTLQSPKSGDLDGVRSSTPAPIRPGIWTTKVYLDSGPMVHDLSVSLEPTEAGWRLELDGLTGDRLVSGQLRVKDRYIPIRAIDLDSGGSTVLMARANASTSQPIGLYADPLKWGEDRRYMHSMYTNVRRDEMSQSLLQLLPGPSERTHSIERLLMTGRFALIELFVTGEAINIPIEADDIQTDQSTMYRLLVPIEGDPRRD